MNALKRNCRVTHVWLRKFLYLLLLTICTKTIAQTDVAGNSMLKKMTPISPEAASLGKYESVPVSLYTGIPDISIPLYEIDVNGFKLPISLSYHAGGNKVEDVASSVGLGWTLNTGGAINRQQKGVADETMVDYYSSYASAVQQMNDPAVSVDTKMNIAANWGFTGTMDHSYDTEPDIFSFSTVKASGKFFHDPQGTVYMLPVKNRFLVKHEDKFTVNTNGKYRWARWLLTDNDGDKYVFGRSLDGLRDNLEQTCTSGVGVVCDDNTSVNSWFLSDIVMSNGQTINYTYDISNYTLNASGTYTIMLPNPCNAYGGNTGVNASIVYKRAARIREIVFPGGKVTFVPGAYRADLPGEKCIDKIEVYRSSKSGSTLYYTLIKAFKFSYSNGDRLQLLSVGEIDITTGLVVKPYTFSYNGSSLPTRSSFSQDFWGYYNGQDGNKNLLPTIYYTSTGSGTVVDGANRSVVDNYTQAGILTRVTYPTGGYSDFTYENNTVTCNAATDAQTFCDILNYTSKYPLVTQTISYQSENLSYSNYETYSPDFTIPLIAGGRGERSVYFSGRYLPYDNATCNRLEMGNGGAKYLCVSVDLERKNADNTYSVILGNITFGINVPLEALGTVYRLHVKWGSSQRGMFYVDTHYSKEYISNQLNIAKGELFAGGLRIKKVVNADPVANITTTRIYDYRYDASDGEALNGASSGVLMNVPMLKFTQPFCYSNGIYGSPILYCGAVPGYSSRSMANVYSGDAINVGYRKVTVYTDEDGKNGKSVSYFSTALDYADGNLFNSVNYPFPESRSNEWKRGLASSVSNYKIDGEQSIQLVDQTTNSYAFYPVVTTDYKEFNAIKINAVPLAATSGGGACGSGYSYVSYPIGTEATYQSESSHLIKVDANNSITQTQTIQQDPQSLETSTVKREMSNGSEITEKIIYVANYVTTATVLSSEAQGIKKLKDYNMLTEPIEKLTIKKNATGEEFVIAGNLIVYYTDKPLPSKVFTFSNQNIPLSSFTFSNINASGNFVKDTRYEERAVFSHYDDAFNLQEQQKSNDVNEVYIWGYNNSYPVAKVLGGNYTTIIGLLNQSIIQNPTSDEQLRTELNKLRTSSISQGAPVLVNTYTYTPLIGMTSETDATGRTTYYEYDNLGRLKVIKDQNGKVLKVLDYQYQTPITQ